MVHRLSLGIVNGMDKITLRCTAMIYIILWFISLYI